MTLNKNEFIMVPFSFIGWIEIRKNRPANVMEPMHACMHVSMHACICVYIQTQIHTCVREREHRHTNTCMHACMDIRMHVFLFE